MTERDETMLVSELLAILKDADQGLEVCVRVQHDDGDQCGVGGITGASIDFGCTDVAVFMIDGNEEEVPDCIQEESDRSHGGHT